MERIPQVTREDVIRIVCRDFSRDDANVALSHLDQYGTESWQGEKDRVQLAILKLSRGELAQLKKLVAVAQRDFRDVLVPAEIPCSFPMMVAGDAGMHAAQLSDLQQADWEQYSAWLGSNERCGGPVDLRAASGESLFFQDPATQHRSPGAIPGWLGPVVGPVVGMLGALSVPDGHGSMLLVLCVGALLGFLAGLVVWAFDRRAG